MANPKIPQLLARKIYKTGQTRGADDDEIFQNRVGRNSSVLIPFSQFSWYFDEIQKGFEFENGYIVLISPDDYFSEGFSDTAKAFNLELGINALVFYEQRSQWLNNNPELIDGWLPATNRTAPLGGTYVARVSATTALESGEKIVAGFNTTKGKGAGIRVYEYASLETVQLCRVQLEALFWLCKDSEEVAILNGMTAEEAAKRKNDCFSNCEAAGLLDYEQLFKNRMINDQSNTVCPLCLESLSAAGFLARMEQALGREVHDLTITQVNLFHIKELRFKAFNHRPYNLGWGHHHCNVVVKDAGIEETLDWMEQVLLRNSRTEKTIAEL